MIPANQRRTQVASTMDLFTTVLELAGVPQPSDRPIDGRSLLDILLDESAPIQHEDMFYWRGRTLMAGRRNAFKLHLATDGCMDYSTPPLQYPSEPLMYHLEHDPSEAFALNTTGLYEFELIAKQLLEVSC